MLAGTALILGLLTPAAPAQTDFVFQNNSGESDVYITFNNTTSEPVYQVSYFDTSKNQTVTLTRNGGGFSDSILLSNVQNGTFAVNNIQSGGFYVSFGQGLSGSAPAPLAPGDSLYGTRYFQVETTIFTPGDTANNGDFTAVNLYSGSVNIENHNGDIVANTVGFGSTSSGPIFQDLYNALSASGELGTATSVNGLTQQSVITKAATLSTPEQFVRVMSPSSWGTNNSPSGNYWVGPYHSFANYVTRLLTLDDGKPQVTNLSYIFQTNSTDYNGGTYPGGLRYVCTFTATPQSRTVANVGTGPTFHLSGTIAVYSLPATQGQQPLGTTGTLTVDLPIDVTNNPELSYLIYGQPGNFTTNTTFSANWGTSGIDANDLILAKQFILGDLQEGMLTGFVGSEVAFNDTNSTLPSTDPNYGKTAKDIPSDVWWSAYTGGMYATLQPESPATAPYYSVYSSVIFPAGNTYSAPYDDRFQTHNPDIPVNTKWVITLNANGNLTPGPTPSPTATPTPAPAVAPTLRLQRKSVKRTGNKARAVIRTIAKAGSSPLRKFQYKYTGHNAYRTVSLPANGQKNITISGLRLGRKITVQGQAIDASNRKSKVAKLNFSTPK